MQEVSWGAGETNEFDITVRHEFFGKRRPPGQPEMATAGPLVHHRTRGERFDLAVLGHGDTEVACVLIGPPHQLGVLHTVAVIGEEAHASICEFGEWRQLLALAAHRDRP